jgi:hypothetical protein
VTDRLSHLEATVDALLLALAVQAGETNDGRLVEAALAELTAQSRETIRILLGSIGHLVHYGSGSDLRDVDRRLTQLFEGLVSALRDAADRGTSGFLPGDLVELTVDRVSDHLRAGTVMRIYFVGDDGTADVGFEELWEEYKVYSVELNQLRPKAPANT